jgi:hypothetical protein
MATNKNRIQKEIIDGGNYHPLLNSFWKLNLDINAKAVWAAIYSCREDFSPSVRGLTDQLKISKTTVKAAIDRLIEVKMLKVEKQGNGFRSNYILTPVTTWMIPDRTNSRPGNDLARYPNGTDRTNPLPGTVPIHATQQEEERREDGEEFCEEDKSRENISVDSTSIPLEKVSPPTLDSILKCYPTPNLDIQARHGDIISCLTEIQNVGHTRASVVSNLNRIAKLWYPSDSYKGPAKRKNNWKAAVDSDFKKALAEVFPPPPSQTPRDSSSVKTRPVSVESREVSDEYQGYDEQAVEEVIRRAKVRNAEIRAKKLKEQAI